MATEGFFVACCRLQIAEMPARGSEQRSASSGSAVVWPPPRTVAALVEDRARLTLRINPGVVIEEDAIASARSRGLIGDKFIAISPGASDQHVLSGGRIRETESPPDITALIIKMIGGNVTGDAGP